MLEKRIRMARVMAGLSLQQLSDKTDNAISKQAISKYEKGVMQPSFENLQAISRALNTRVDYFLRDSTLDLGEIKYRKQTKLPKKKQNEITERTRDFLERYLETELLLNLNQEVSVPNRNIKVNSEDDVEVVTNQLRYKWDLGSNSIYNILETIEQLGIKVIKLKESINHFYGMSTWVSKKVPVIVLSEMNKDRLRFTALHELGHLVLDIEHLEDKFQEKICDRFAASMLLPKSALLSELGGHRKNIHLRELVLIKAEYGISPQAILYRAKDLGLITEAYFISQVKYLRFKGLWRKNIGKYEGEEKSNRLLQLLCRGVAEEFITSSKAASLYNMKLADFRKEISGTYASSNN